MLYQTFYYKKIFNPVKKLIIILLYVHMVSCHYTLSKNFRLKSYILFNPTVLGCQLILRIKICYNLVTYFTGRNILRYYDKSYPDWHWYFLKWKFIWNNIYFKPLMHYIMINFTVVKYIVYQCSTVYCSLVRCSAVYYSVL